MIYFGSRYLPLETHERLLVTSQKFGKIYAKAMEMQDKAEANNGKGSMIRL